jgi:hypothetical protein
VPKGPVRALKDALRLLGTFSATSLPDSAVSEALETGGFKDPEDMARALIADAATSFNQHQHRYQNAPRAKHVIGQLQNLTNATADLVEVLRGLDDLVRAELQITRRRDRTQRMHVLADGSLPLPGGEDATGMLVEELDALRDVATVTKDTFIAECGGRDRGGNTNAYKVKVGHPKWGLVADALEIFDIFRPGEAKATEGSDCYLFLHAVYEHATGISDEDKAAIGHYLKEVIAPWRELTSMRKAKRELIREMAESTANSDFADLMRRECELSASIEALHSRVYPQHFFG